MAVLPFPDPDAPWPAASRARYRSLVEGAVDRVVVDPTPPASKQRAGAAIGRRDGWLARHATEALVVWDRHDPDVGRLVRSYEDHLGETEVWVVEP